MLNTFALFVDYEWNVSVLVPECVLNVRISVAECVLVEDVLEVALILKGSKWSCF